MLLTPQWRAQGFLFLEKHGPHLFLDAPNVCLACSRQFCGFPDKSPPYFRMPQRLTGVLKAAFFPEKWSLDFHDYCSTIISLTGTPRAVPCQDLVDPRRAKYFIAAPNISVPHPYDPCRAKYFRAVPCRA